MPVLYHCAMKIMKIGQKNYKYLKEPPFLITIFVRSDIITNSPKMLTKQKKRGKFKFPQSPWILGDMSSTAEKT